MIDGQPKGGTMQKDIKQKIIILVDSHATQLLLAGVHPKVAQERLGHSTITTTLDLYSHVTETMQENAAERLDDVLGPAINRAAGVK